MSNVVAAQELGYIIMENNNKVVLTAARCDDVEDDPTVMFGYVVSIENNLVLSGVCWTKAGEFLVVTTETGETMRFPIKKLKNMNYSHST